VNVIDLPEPTKVMASGDWHASQPFAVRSIDYAVYAGADAIVQCGDFGLWTPSPRLDLYISTITRLAKETEIHVYWLDGNHEDHSRRDQFASYDTEYFHYLPRGHRWSWWGKQFMSVGGGVSMDKKHRKEGVSWWPGETLSDEELDFCCRIPHGLDVIFAHDCPRGVPIPGVGPESKQRPGESAWPADVLYEASQHRDKMREIWECHQPQLYAHGHYHIPYEFWLRDTKFIGLGMHMDMMKDTVFFIGPDDLK
jgi:predicted phosphodiesterase